MKNDCVIFDCYLSVFLHLWLSNVFLIIDRTCSCIKQKPGQPLLCFGITVFSKFNEVMIKIFWGVLIQFLILFVKLIALIRYRSLYVQFVSILNFYCFYLSFLAIANKANWGKRCKNYNKKSTRWFNDRITTPIQ